MDLEKRYKVVRKEGGLWETKAARRGEVSDFEFENYYFESKELALKMFANKINKLNKELNLLIKNLNADKSLPNGIIQRNDILFYLSSARKNMTKIINSDKFPMDQRMYLRGNRTTLSDMIKNLQDRKLINLDHNELIKFRKYYGGV